MKNVPYIMSTEVHVQIAKYVPSLHFFPFFSLLAKNTHTLC